MEPTNVTTTAPAAQTSAAPAPKANKKKPAAKKVAKPASKSKSKAKPSANGTALSGLAAARPEWEGRTANFRRDGALTKRQVDVLRVLNKRNRPVSADDVADALKLPDASRKTVRWAVGSVRTEDQDPFSLLARKLVKFHEVSPTGDEGGRKEHLFEITASGKVALRKAEAE